MLDQQQTVAWNYTWASFPIGARQPRGIQTPKVGQRTQTLGM